MAIVKVSDRDAADEHLGNNVRSNCWLLLVWCFLTGVLVAQEGNDWTMELRVAASRIEDVAIVESASNSDGQEVYSDGKLIAKWMPILESVETSLEENSELVMRQGKEGRSELLVLVTSNDVTESDVRKIYVGKDMQGGTALKLVFTDEGSSKVFNLTKSMVRYGDQRRYIAEIMDGKVYAALGVHTPVSKMAHITGDISEVMIEDIKTRSRPGLFVGVLDESEMPPYAITISPLRLVLLFVVLLIAILGSLPAKGLKQSKHPRSWVVIGIIVGALFGGYLLGFSVTHGTADVGGGVSAIATITSISILWVLVGGVVGAGPGFLAGVLCRFFVRRAIYNVGRLVCRSQRADEPADMTE